MATSAYVFLASGIKHPAMRILQPPQLFREGTRRQGIVPEETHILGSSGNCEC